MPTTMTHTKECLECGGVMKKVWGDMKTRSVALRCLRCENETSVHENKTDYLELRHADAFEELDTGLDYDEFKSAAEGLNLETTDEAFTPDGTWSAVRVAVTDDNDYLVTAYDGLKNEDAGVGEEEHLPYATGCASWRAESVYLGESELEIVPINDGSAWTYFRFVNDVSIEDGGRLIGIDL